MTIEDNPTVTRESFQALPTENKLDILFDYITRTHNEIMRLKKTKMRNTIYASLCGFIGGATTVISLRVGEFFK